MNDFELLKPIGGNLLDLDNPVGDGLNPVQFSRTGDLFNANVFLGIGTIYRAWHLNVSCPKLGRREQAVKISLRLNPISSVFVLIINGEAKLKHQSGFDESGMKIRFKLFDCDFELLVTAVFPKISYNFELKLNGHDVKDIRVQKTLSDMMEPYLPRNIQIPSVRTCALEKKSVVIYQVYSEINNSEKIMVEKRFSDFVKLDQIIHGHFGSTHLKDTLPVLPSRIYNPFFDQTDFSFIVSRRTKLEEYLSFLLSHEKVFVISTFLAVILIFVGLCSY
jgi:hypothetical protein